MDVYNAGNRIVNTYLYRISDGCVMIDTGYAHSLKKVEKKAKSQGIALSEVRYVFLTHSHDDHAGFLNELLSNYPNIKVILHSQAVPVLLRGQNSFEGGCSGLPAFLFCKLMGLFGKGSHRFPPLDRRHLHRLIELSPQNLADIETILQGKILCTPGHTADSISLKVGRNIFCGDAAMNGFPSRKRVTIWIEHKTAFQTSWQRLLDEPADWLFPAHGKPFRKEELKTYLDHILKIRLYRLK